MNKNDNKPWTKMNSGVVRDAIPAEQLGRAEISPAGEFVAGSYASFTLTYTAGLYGIDDSGSLRVCSRFASDQSNPQFDDPEGVNYCTVEASNGATLQLRWDQKANVRPWDRTLWIKIVKGYLCEGDTITIRFGVTDHGSPGMRLQTFCEDTFEFRVLADPIATYNFQPLPVQPTVAIVPGLPERILAVLPTRRCVGEKFSLKIKGEDKWGNPSDKCDARFDIEVEGEIDGLPHQVSLPPGEYSFEIDGLSVAHEGRVSVVLRSRDGQVAARTNPLLIQDQAVRHYWADMHGQSEETIGTGSADAYFSFARNLGFVDACGHQGNDFQITDAFWDELNRITTKHDAPGEFVALPGYEWSGNTALGGDRNVFFPTDDRIIRRSSHAMIGGGDTAGTDAPTAVQLFKDFAEAQEWDVVMYAHCGGRYADIGVAHDGRFERSVEVHSAWGTFEWILHDALKLGYRVGVVANSDGHKGRPGASYPGASKFGAVGGLTCFMTEKLDRASLLDCMRKRHHYGTTGGPGGRMLLEVEAEFEAEGTVYHDDPALFKNAPGQRASKAIMGDIVHLPQDDMSLRVKAETTSPIERIDIFNGTELIETIRPYEQDPSSPRIRVLWEGATYRGRFREVIWDGSATISGNEITTATPINFLNRDNSLERVDNTLSWQALTTGNFGGFELTLKDPMQGRLDLKTDVMDVQVEISDIGVSDLTFDKSGELPVFIRVFRLPMHNDCVSCDLTVPVSLHDTGDNALYVRLTQEDGTRAWTSPIYVYR